MVWCVEYRILGRLEVWTDGRSLVLGGLRQRRVLAALLLRAGRVVPVADLIAAAWDDDPPVTAAQQVRNRVGVLRSMLTRHGGLIDTVDSGYRLRLGGASLDLAVFEELVARGRAARDPAPLREALGLWRGSALDGLGGVLLSRAVAALEESRLAVVEDCLTWESDRSAVSVDELRDLVAVYPLRERLVGLLMAALARNGRRDEALAVYRSLAVRLAEELGINPSPELRRRYQALRRAEVPAQLPGDVAGFVGRAGELARLDGLLSDRRAGRSAVLSAIGGTAGVGKTALAVHWAHRVRDKFPDGQLYVNLHGYSPAAPADPAAVLGGFLRALGVPDPRIPAEAAAAAVMFREHLADRRVLVVLDNAADAEQVRPLLPDAPGCLALVTSRQTLAALADAVPVNLDMLPPGDAIALLMGILGAGRVAAEPAAAAEVARLCAYLPLALRIAAANLSDEESIAGYAARLAASEDRLAALSVAGDERAAVRTAFELSYTDLPAPAKRMFRLLGVAPGPDISVPAAACLAAVDQLQAKDLLDRLVAAHLVDEDRPGRYNMHDLLRAYATQLAHTTDADPQRQTATHRVLDHYLHTAYTADRLLDPARDMLALTPPQPRSTPEHPTDRAQALAWFTAERPVLVAAVDHAAATGFDTHTWQLTWVLGTFLDWWGHWHDWAATGRAAVAAAGRLGDPTAQARAHRILARAYSQLGRLDDAHTHLTQALNLAARAGDPIGQAHTHVNLAYLCERQGHPAHALEHARHTLHLFRAVGHQDGLADALNAVGWFHALLGDHQQALTYCQQALTLLQELDDRVGQANTWDSLGYAHHHLGHHAQALTCYQHALNLIREVGHRYYEATFLTRLGDAHHAAGNDQAARDAWQHALTILDDLDDLDADNVRAKLTSPKAPPEAEGATTIAATAQGKNF
jgi:DNA-binding SARP family transcriptional activator/tetratricopeptide (TPR) repeat protein